MGIAEKLTTIAENEQKVFDAGKQAEYDEFWDNFQRYGKRDNYQYFCKGINAETESWLRPKYPIKCTDISFAWSYCDLEVDLVEYLAEKGIEWDFTNGGNGVNAQQLFAVTNLTRIGELVFIPTNMHASNGTFHNSRKIVTIDKVTFSENHTCNNVFEYCYALVNVTVAGTIGQTINLQWCPLSVESMKSIITHLKDYSGTNKAYTTTINMTNECWERLEEDSTAPDGGTWANYVDGLGWNI